MIARELAAQPDVQVAAIGQGSRRPEDLSNIQYEHYENFTGPPAVMFPPIQGAADNVRRGRSVADIMFRMRDAGYEPDYIIAHPGWGDATFVKEVFPRAHFIAYMEYYYRGKNSDADFDPEFKPPEIDLPFTRLRNLTNALAFAECDQAITPTHWQASLFPPKLKSQLIVQHEGIDCTVAAPKAAKFALSDGRELSKKDEVVTYAARSLEPYRGFHIFMRALPQLLKTRPRCQVVIVGQDGVSYGRRPRQGGSWKDVMLRELEGTLDLARVHFVDRLAYDRLIDLFNISSAHVYLTYPFVLSWSVLEAMACECVVIGSNTGPVTEVITDGETGHLVDFFAVDALAEKIASVLADPEGRQRVGKKARAVILERYDFKTRILPRYEKMLAMGEAVS